MPALDAGIHVFLHAGSRPWMAGTKPGHDEANSARPSGNKPDHDGSNNKPGHDEGEPSAPPIHIVMPALVAGIHVLTIPQAQDRGWPGRSPAMTEQAATPGHRAKQQARS